MKTVLFSCLFFLMVSVLCGCTRLMMFVWGVKEPKVETIASISEFTNSIGVHTENLMIAKDSVSLHELITSVKSIPEAEFFDCNGALIPYKDEGSNQCNAGVDAFIELLTIKRQLSTHSQHLQSRLSRMISIPSKQDVLFRSLPRSDYYVLLYFTKWSGKKVNREHITEWVNHIQSSNNSNEFIITYLIVNLDFMDVWGVSIENLEIRRSYK